MLQQKFVNNLIDTEIKIAWSHWNQLGAIGSGKKSICSTDPEALILLTSVLGKHEKRLVNAMNSWLAKYESRVSIERLKRYLKELNLNKKDACGYDILKETVLNCVSKRWLPIASMLGIEIVKHHSVDIKTSSKKLDIHEKIIQKNLQLYLRFMFGPGTKADVIYFFLVVFEQKKKPLFFPSTPQISKMLHYNNSSIYRTIQDLEMSGFLKKKPGKEVYSVNFNASVGMFKEPFRWQNETTNFIDWLGIIKICLLTEQLRDKIENINEASIIKSRLQDYIKACEKLMNESWINFDSTFSIKTQSALMHIGFDELQSQAMSQLDGMYEFLTSRY